jgi:hypothetical protein
MASIPIQSSARLLPGVLIALAIALGGAVAGAQTPPATPALANTTTPANTTAPANTTTPVATPPAKGAKKAKVKTPPKAKKPPKDAAPDEASAIAAGKEACGEIGETYAKEHWRAQNQRGVWRVWVTPVHCDGGGTCPTFEVHITVSDGVASACTQRIALY